MHHCLVVGCRFRNAILCYHHTVVEEVVPRSCGAEKLSACVELDFHIEGHGENGVHAGWSAQDVGGSPRRTMSNLFLPISPDTLNQTFIALDAKKTLVNAFVASRLD